MEQFSLEKHLENPSRKVITRDGREVEIVKYDMKGTHFPVLYVISNEDGSQEPCECSKSGMCQFDNTQSSTDLFFADEEEKPQSIEIPFGAFDSEFVKDEYYIPEGCEARIEGNKVIIEKIQKEELTEFEKELINLVFKYKYWDSSKDKVKQGIKKDSKLLLDLARKEIRKEQQEKLGTLEMPIDVTEPYYIKGKQDALKSLPKWKKATEYKEFEVHVCVMDEDMCMDEDTYTYLDTTVIEGEYYIELSDLKTLPKEE